MSTLFESYDGSIDDHDSLLSTGNHDVGQAFANGTAGNLTSIKMYLVKVGSPTGNATAKLYAITGSLGTTAVPTGSALATSNNFDVSTLTTSDVLTEITFPTSYYHMSVGNYAIVIHYTGGDGSNYIRVGGIFSGSDSGNIVLSTDSTNWSTGGAGADKFYFIYGNPVTVYTMVTAPASFSYTPVSVMPTKLMHLITDKATYILTGISSELKRGWQMITSPATFTLTTMGVGFKKIMHLVTAPATYTIIGITIGINKSLTMVTAPAKYILTGSAITFTKVFGKITDWLNPHAQDYPKSKEQSYPKANEQHYPQSKNQSKEIK